MPDQDLNLNFNTTGADKAVADLGKLDAAQGKVTDASKTGAKGTKELTDAQVNLNAAEGDYISLLAFASPQVQIAADAALKFAKVTEGLTGAQGGLGTILAKVTSGLKANAGALKLVGAAGAAALAIFAIVKQYQALNEELKLNKELLEAEATSTAKARDEREKLLTVLQEEANVRQKIANLTLSQTAEIQAEAEGIAARFPGVEVAPTALLLAQLSLSGVPREKRQKVAVGVAGGGRINLDPSQGAIDIQVEVTRAINDPTFLAKIAAKTRDASDVARRQGVAILQQARAGKGELLEAAIARLTSDPVEQARLAELSEITGGTPGGVRDAISQGRSVGVLGQIVSGQFPSTALQIRSQVREDILGGGMAEAVTPRMLNMLQFLVQNVEELRSQRASIIINNGPSAESKQNRETRPDTIANDREGR